MIEQRDADLLQTLMNDGPPVLLVLLVFVALQAVVMGRQHPLTGAVIVALGLLAAAVIELIGCWRGGGDGGRDGFWMRPAKR